MLAQGLRCPAITTGFVQGLTCNQPRAGETQLEPSSAPLHGMLAPAGGSLHAPPFPALSRLGGSRCFSCCHPHAQNPGHPASPCPAEAPSPCPGIMWGPEQCLGQHHYLLLTGVGGVTCLTILPWEVTTSPTPKAGSAQQPGAQFRFQHLPKKLHRCLGRSHT